MMPVSYTHLNLAGLVTSIKEVATQPDPVEEADTTEK